MLRSMFAGVSGLRSHQVKMDVIGNNIANVNTMGYKASRTTFQEMYSQTMRSASAPGAAVGGINPAQIGLGTKVASIDVLHTGGGLQTTDKPLDFAIDGEGFFVVQQGQNNFYTRAGNLERDSDGFLVAANGMYVQGMCLLDDEYLPDDVDITMLKISDPADLETLTDIDFDTHMGRILIPHGMFKQFVVSGSGLISGYDENDNLVPIGQIVLSTFVNPAGLERVGSGLYQKTNNSGEPLLDMPNSGGAGAIQQNHLEMSNVDLSREFTDMIITQRGYQANSRIITVSDTLLEELINLKR